MADIVVYSSENLDEMLRSAGQVSSRVSVEQRKVLFEQAQNFVVSSPVLSTVKQFVWPHLGARTPKMRIGCMYMKFLKGGRIGSNMYQKITDWPEMSLPSPLGRVE